MIEISAEQEQRARALHERSFVFDFSPHGEPFVATPRQDAVMEAALEERASLGEILRRMAFERLRELEDDSEFRAMIAGLWRSSGVDSVQVTLGGAELLIDDWEAVLRDGARWHARERGIGDMAVCTRRAELEGARRDGRVGLLLGLQDTTPVGADLGRIDHLHALGVRVMQLTYNRRNLVGDGCMEREQSGLSRFGVDLVRAMNERGIVVDVSHSGYQTTLDAIELSERPIAFTHVGCTAVNDHPRCKTDDQIRALAESGGYLGVVGVPFFLRSNPRAGIEDFLTHLEHAAGIMDVHRVGIATDWGFWSTDFPRRLFDAARAEFVRLGFGPQDIHVGESLGEFVQWTDWPHLTRGLVSAGYDDDEIEGILGRNWLDFLERSMG